ncbi:phytanoyl-CoA dioxygenase family protein [Rhizohabitans arisaemae]|uniref:phytanoyl-CoA dioxygenase family protein n=1 Tax=Rhizohabitans arisaemae TaxID=2720610 RepID=UPI0024B0DE23|nr:phytanoyl-CoA dioxygenase family protein [Rhizohabitans arisaemae]
MTSVTGGLTLEQRSALEDLGFVKLTNIADHSMLDAMRDTYDRAWDEGESGITERLHLLRYAAFREFIDSASALAAPRSVYGAHLQLLDYWLTYQPGASRWRTPKYTVPTERDWHRDVSFVGADPARPLTLNMLLFLDDTKDRSGPTVVLPGSHRSRYAAVSEHSTEPHPDEVAIPLEYGEALLFNSHLVHSRGRNRSNRPRRGVALLWGFWFIKPTGAELPICPEAVTDASEDRLRLLGLSQPTVDLYLFEGF